MANTWKCTKCGGGNPLTREHCLGCGDPRPEDALQDLGESQGAGSIQDRLTSSSLSAAIDKTKEFTKDTASRVKQTTGQAVDLGKGKLRDITTSALSELEGLKPILGAGGFMITETNLTLGLMPELELVIEHAQEGKKSLEQMLEEDDGNLSALQKAILTSLSKAHDLSETTRKRGYAIGGYEVAMTLPPTVTLCLVPTKPED